ncbi:MAG: hypothetical protein IKV44_06395 [Clostridia bacterium]|nr:hypothetical protein [Clostridia bacterium]
MKKLVSVVLAVIIALSCCSLIGFAAEDDNYTKSYFVIVAPDCQEKLAITSLSGSEYVIEGGTFQFTAEAINGHVFDQTTVLKVANTHYEMDVVLGVDSEYGYIIEPDAEGVYTIENVEEDLYIYVANLEKESFASLKDFLFNMMNFFLNLMKWFFGV